MENKIIVFLVIFLTTIAHILCYKAGCDYEEDYRDTKNKKDKED